MFTRFKYIPQAFKSTSEVPQTRSWTHLSCPQSLQPVPGKFLGIVGQDPSDSKSHWLHVRHLPVLLHSFEVYSSIESSKVFGNPPKVSNFNRIFSSNWTGPSVTNCQFSPDNDTNVSVWFQPWNCWGSFWEIDAGPPLFTPLLTLL